MKIQVTLTKEEIIEAIGDYLTKHNVTVIPGTITFLYDGRYQDGNQEVEGVTAEFNYAKKK